jgi:peptide/nickel transport system permease protein
MTAYIIRRLLQLPITVFFVSVLIFLMLQLLTPVERSALYVRDIPHTEGALEATIRRYGLDDPVWVQYGRWLVGRNDSQTGQRVGGILRGDFGFSRTGREPVIDVIKRRFPASLELALWSIVPIIGVGIWMGVVAAVHHNKLIDQVLRVFALVGWSFPTFVFALLLLLIFYAKTGWFPPGRLSEWATSDVLTGNFQSYTQLYTIDALLNLRLDIFADALKHMVLPVFTLCYIQWAMLLRLTRSSMLEALRQDYMYTARAKGLPEDTVINLHARRNALLPVVTVTGLTIVGLMGGVVITETIFDYPGLGRAAANAAASLDVLTVLGIVLLFSVMLVLANLIVDVLYAFFDPRVRLS